MARTLALVNGITFIVFGVFYAALLLCLYWDISPWWAVATVVLPFLAFLWREFI